MGVVAVSPLRRFPKIKCKIIRLSEDIWLTRQGDMVSYIDIFVRVEQDTHEDLSSLLLVMDAEVRQVNDVSFLWYENIKKFSEGVGGYMYSRGMKKISEDENRVQMSVDGVECIVPKKLSVHRMGDISPNIARIDFPKPPKRNETIGMKIEVLQSAVYLKSEVYPTENSRFFEIFPYCHWAIGVDKLNEFGFEQENLVPIEAYYLYLFLPPGFETDRTRTTEFMTIDLSKCESCTRFCPFLERISDLTGTPLNQIKKDREGIRWKLENVTEWRGRSIGVLFAPSSPTVKPFKVRLIQNILSLLLIGFCINVIAGLVFNYNLPLLMISVVLLIVAIIPLIYILKRYPK